MPALLLFMDPIKTVKPKSLMNPKIEVVDVNNGSPKSQTFLKTGAFWVYVFQQILLNVGVACGCLYTAAHIVKVSNADEMDAAFLISLQGGIEALVRIPFGYLADRQRLHTLMDCINPFIFSQGLYNIFH